MTYEATFTGAAALYQAVKRAAPGQPCRFVDYSPSSYGIWVGADNDAAFLLSIEAEEDGGSEWTYERRNAMLTGPLSKWRDGLAAWALYNRVDLWGTR